MLKPAQLESFFQYLRFPTISAEPARKQAMYDCTAMLREKFVGLGFEAQVHETPGAPVFVAKSAHDPTKKTVLIYGHYDVQPVDPLELWEHPPFEPHIKEGLITARGATDNKGQTWAHVLGTEAFLAQKGTLPVNLIYLIEGEEEIGSANLFPFLEAHREDLACDIILISDTSMVAPGFPAITCGLRGIACMEVVITGPKADLHSGMFGGVVGNPAQELARLLAKLHDSDHAVNIPGFYEDVLQATKRERESWKDLPYNEKAIQTSTGCEALTGEAGYSALERIWVRPTAEINGLTSGYQGPGSKTIIPSQASAKLSFRLVPNQNPEVVAGQIRQFFQSEVSPAFRLQVTYDHGGLPYYNDPESAESLAAQAALKTVFGRAPALIREGLSIPIVTALQRALNCPPLLIGLGMPDCSAHSPNETFPLVQLEKGIELHQALLEIFAAC